jgi:hypothetical protein
MEMAATKTMTMLTEPWVRRSKGIPVMAAPLTLNLRLHTPETPPRSMAIALARA